MDSVGMRLRKCEEKAKNRGGEVTEDRKGRSYR
jgi:hypothetical protein